MLSAVLIRTQTERNDFIEWMQQRGATVAGILRSCDVKARWLAMLQSMQRWQGLDVEDDSPLAQPRQTFDCDAVVAQRGIVRILLPDLDDHASVFCAAAATLLALDSEDSFELLVAIEAAFTPAA
jgi:hypothetical protein